MQSLSIRRLHVRQRAHYIMLKVPTVATKECPKPLPVLLQLTTTYLQKVIRFNSKSISVENFYCELNLICLLFSSNVVFLASLPYEKGIKGENNCKTGSEILVQSECKSACNQLNIKHGSLWTADKPCIIRPNGVCAQSDGPPTIAEATLICKKSGY